MSEPIAKHFSVRVQVDSPRAPASPPVPGMHLAVIRLLFKQSSHSSACLTFSSCRLSRRLLRCDRC
eukprot:4705559-Pleurochrysis_carterae.AAC.1